MNAPTIEHMSDTVQHVTDTVQDAAHKVVERAPDIATTVGRSAHKVVERTPDIASAVGRGARSTVDNVSDAVVKLAALTPFVEAPAPQRNRARWILRAAIVATIAGLAMWFVNRRRSGHPWYEVDETATAEPAQPAQRRYATAGR